MFLNKNSEEEFFNEVSKKLSKEHNKENYYVEKINHVVDLLISGARHLKKAGLEKEANVIVMMTKDICDDPAVKVSPEDMIKNLGKEGWVFPPAKDLNLIEDDANTKPESLEEDPVTKQDEEEIEKQTAPDLHEF